MPLRTSTSCVSPWTDPSVSALTSLKGLPCCVELDDDVVEVDPLEPDGLLPPVPPAGVLLPLEDDVSGDERRRSMIACANCSRSWMLTNSAFSTTSGAGL